MAIFINEVRLTNWFNFMGEPDESSGKNIIHFTSGLNIFVGDNNGGKSKLHNAFRYILSNKVLLKINNNKNIFETVGKEKEILNNQIFLKARHGDKLTFGVELYFTKERKSTQDKKQYCLRKFISGRKDVNNFVRLKEDVEKAYKLDKTTGSLIEEDNYGMISSILMTPNYMNFFLVEGEQMGLMTPLEGEQLQTTINLIDSSLKLYNNTFKDVKAVKSSVMRNSGSEKKRIASGNEADKQNADELSRIKESKLPTLVKKIELLQSKESDLKQTIVKYEDKAKESETLAKLKRKIDNFNYEINQADENWYRKKLNFTKNLVKDDFFIANINDDRFAINKLNDLVESTKDYITERKIELEPNTSEHELNMLQSLDKSQPNPNILRKMIAESVCYVCQTEIEKRSKSWIENKLIPFFENVNENDETLKQLEELKSFFSFLYSQNENKKLPKLGTINTIKEEITTAAFKKREVQEAKENFEETHEIHELSEADKVTIDTYITARDLLTENRQEFALTKQDLNKYKNREKELNDLLRNVTKNNPKLNKLYELDLLLEDLDSELAIEKKKIYSDFAKSLEEKATKRFNKFLKRNQTAKDQRVVVELIQNDVNFEFKIYVVDKMDIIQSQSGGAQDALEKLSVVFGLLDLSQTNAGYPFIADAPTSHLSDPQQESFYQQILNDQALNQTILMTMDLWSNSQNNLNELGEKVCQEIEKFPNSSLNILKAIGVNSGVEILKINS